MTLIAAGSLYLLFRGGGNAGFSGPGRFLPELSGQSGGGLQVVQPGFWPELIAPIFGLLIAGMGEFSSFEFPEEIDDDSDLDVENDIEFDDCGSFEPS